MKRITTLSKSVVVLCGTLCVFLAFQSCVFTENLEGDYSVIKEELIGEYLAKDTTFTEFTRMLDTTGVMGLLNAYGMYTVFAPTNDAIQRYYRTLMDENGHYTYDSMEDLSLSEITEFCYNHIVKNDTLKTKNFKKGTLPSRTMSERYITISFEFDSIMVNGISPILQKDIEKHNGMIQVLGEAFSPSRSKICEAFEGDSARYSIYVKALKMTGLYDIMLNAPVEDVNWNPNAGWPIETKKINSDNPDVKPKSRKFGYTILAVSDADLKKCKYPEVTGLPGGMDLSDGIDDVYELEALANYYYGKQYGDADAITSRRNRKNYLNRFMSYHCLDRVATSSRFIRDFFTKHHYKGGVSMGPMPDYVSTLLENSILETLYDEDGVIIGSMKATYPNYIYGVFNFDDSKQRAVLTNDRDLPNGGSVNGYYHGITRPLMFNRDLSDALSSKRLRMDVASFLPELTTNNIRGGNSDRNSSDTDEDLKKIQENPERCHIIDDSYVDGFWGSPNTRFKYVGISPYWEDYQGDEFYVTKQYNFTMETLPIPAGTYEIRMGYEVTGSRAVSQIYFDSLPCGIPLDLAITGDDAGMGIGWLEPKPDDEDDPNGYENDKMMHNRGYMKGPTVFRASSSGGGKGSNKSSTRMTKDCLRRVLGIYTFEKTEKHYFSTIYLGSTKGISGDPQFMIDYIEFCPIEMLEKEGID